MNGQIKEKYNIAFLMHGARNVGGGEHSIYYLIKGLRKDIFNPFVFFVHKNEIIHKIQEEGIRTVQFPIHEKIISVYRDKIKYNPYSLLFYLFYLGVAVCRIKTLLKKHKVVLLHPHDNLSKVIGGIAAKIEGIKVVAHCRDGLIDDLIGNILRKVYLQLTDRIIAVSNKTSQFFDTGNKLSNKKLKVIYNGVDLNLFNTENFAGDIRRKLKITNSCTVIGVIGVLEKYKGHIYLLQAIEKLKLEGISNFKCLFIGKGKEEEELRYFVKEKSLIENILFLGYRKDIPQLLMGIDILTVPSIEQEAFPRVALEAMAMKVPVVCTDFGGLPEAVVDKETGLIFPTKDSGKLYEHIKFLIGNPKVRKEMGNAGRKRVEKHFSIDENIRKTEELYLDVLKGF